MNWTIAKARQHFSELLQEAAREPQAVCNRNRPVAAVVDFETYRKFAEWQAAIMNRTIGDAFDDLRGLCAGAIDAPERSDRDDAWTQELDELPR